MSPFQYARPTSLDDAVAKLQAPGALPLGGGTDLLPQVRDALANPEVLVDLRRIPFSADITWLEDGGVRIGATHVVPAAMRSSTAYTAAVSCSACPWASAA